MLRVPLRRIGCSYGGSRAVLALIVVAALAAPGCTGDDDDRRRGNAATTTSAATKAPTRPPTRRPEGRARVGSPEAAVNSLFYWARWGAQPNVVDAFHPLVRDRIGATDIAGTFAAQRQVLIETKIRLLVQHSTSRGVFVAAEFRATGGQPSYESFLLRRVGNAWKIAYDTFFERAYSSYVQSRTQLESRSSGDKPSNTAIRAGDAGASLYRSLFLSG